MYFGVIHGSAFMKVPVGPLDEEKIDGQAD